MQFFLFKLSQMNRKMDCRMGKFEKKNLLFGSYSQYKPFAWRTYRRLKFLLMMAVPQAVPAFDWNDSRGGFLRGRKIGTHTSMRWIGSRLESALSLLPRAIRPQGLNEHMVVDLMHGWIVYGEFVRFARGTQ